ncbi:MAG: DUF935 family protein, partial [Verrucomicrobia bacterium]|nr:DUF935 family protein [Verrucomicrobiota bacterium]
DGVGTLFIDERPAVSEARTLALSLNGLSALTAWPAVDWKNRDTYVALPGGLTWDGRAQKWLGLRCAVVRFTRHQLGAGLEQGAVEFTENGVTKFVPVIACNRFETVDRVVRELLTPSENVVEVVPAATGDHAVRTAPALRLPSPAPGGSPLLDTLDAHFLAGAQRAALQSGAGFGRGLTPDALAQDLEHFSLGYLRSAVLRWQRIRERDDTIKSVAEKRELDAALLDWSVLPLDASPEAAAHQAALEEFYHGLTATHALDQNQRGGVATLVRQMMRAVGDKYAVHEIVWQPGATAGLTAEFRYCPLQFFENTTGRLRFLAQDNVYPGEDLAPGGWMVTVGAGLFEATSVAYLFKNLPLRSWLTYCDKFGLPGLHGETTAAFGSEEWNRFRDALATFSQDWALLTSAGAKITPLEVNASGTVPHKDLIDRMDRAITRLWRGADLGTMSHAQSAVGSQPQESETEILAAADALLISETLQHYVDAWVIRYRFGTTPRAYFKLQPRTKTNWDQELRIDDALIRWGIPRAQSELLARYGRPAPAAGEALATPTPSSAHAAPSSS